MPTTVNTNAEVARSNFLTWWMRDGNTLGEGKEYGRIASRVKEVSKHLLSHEMTLSLHDFPLEFSFYYGEKPNTNQLLPISWQDGQILKWQHENEKEIWWPIKDLLNNSYFVPKLTLHVREFTGRDESTNQYLTTIVKMIDECLLVQEARILKALIPYANEVRACCNDWTYRKIVKFVPELSDYVGLKPLYV
jgi:hypothetical protein